MTAKKITAVIKRQAPALIVAVGATIALAAGVGAGYWAFLQRQLISARLPVGVENIPQDAWMTLTVATDPSQWQELRQLGTVKTQALLDARLVEWRDRLVTDYGYNYQRDIQPWIGSEITLAFLSTSTPSSPTPPSPLTTPPKSSLVMVLPIADVTRVQRLWTDPQTAGGRQWTTDSYKGIQIRETKVNQHALVVGVLGNQEIVVSPDRPAVEQEIDTYRGADSVAKIPGYQQNLDHMVVADPFLRLYLNAAQVQTIVAADSIQAVPSWIFGFLQGNQGIAAAVSLKADRIQIQAAGWLPSNSDRRYSVENKATAIPAFLPEETLMMLTGGDIQALWQQFNQLPIADPKSLSNPANLRQGIQETTGLDLEQDILSWMNGEFAIALVPRVDPQTVKQTLGVVILAKAKDRVAADDTFKRLDGVMGDRYHFQVKESKVDNQPVTNWVSPFGALTLTRGWLPGNVAFLSLGAPLADVLLPAPNLPLTQRDRFRAASASEFNANNGQLFIDVDRLTNPRNALPLPQLPPPIATVAEAINAIGMTTTMESDRTIRYDINILMPKTNHPRPLPQ